MADYPVTMTQAQLVYADDPEGLRHLEEQVQRIARANQEELGAVTHWLPAREISAADLASPLGPFSAFLKANIACEGASTHCGSLFLTDYISPFSATAVERLCAAGSRLTAITAMDEFGMGSSSEFTSLGHPVNPWHPRRTAGGSSGGSAAAVAAGHAWYALGSDTGGSVRQPAHCCGVVGLKPTWGRVSRYGLVAFASSLDTIGVLSRGVEDAWAVFRCLAGPDPRDGTSLGQPPLTNQPLTTELLPTQPLPAAPVKGLRCGIPLDLGETAGLDDLSGLNGPPGMALEPALEPALLANQNRCQEWLRDLGAELVPVSLRPWQKALACYTVLNAAEAVSNLLRFDGSLYGLRGEGETFQKSFLAGRTQGLGPEVKRRILLGSHVLSAGYRDRYYWRARATRQTLVKYFEDIFADVDCLLCPTAPTTAFPLGSRVDDPQAMRNSDIFTIPASLAGIPALTIPTGTDANGLPLSAQLLAPWWAEKELCQVGLALERQASFQGRKVIPWANL